MKLSIIIPAYNEEDAIESIIERSLAARPVICEKTPVTEVEIIVVSDGSHDSTAEKARKYPEINLIAYEKNRGYGAAIKTGFSSSRGDLVSFLDADGTCDPLFFVELVNLLIQENAQVSLGSRLHDNSEMPKTRRLGNRIFARIINYFAGTHITDSASGMRVIRREALKELYPLPDGLHFTPAMSTKAVMDENLKIVETPMPYKERIGESKLSVVKDGVRFLKIIVDIALTYVPQKIFGMIGIIFLLLSFWIGVGPTMFYLKHKSLEENMILQLIPVVVFGVSGLSFLLIGQISNEVCAILNRRSEKNRLILPITRRLLNQKWLIWAGIALSLLGIFLSGISYVAGIIFGGDATVKHWSYPLTGGFLFLLGAHLGALGVLLRIILSLRAKADAMRDFEKK